MVKKWFHQKKIGGLYTFPLPCQDSDFPGEMRIGSYISSRMFPNRIFSWTEFSLLGNGDELQWPFFLFSKLGRAFYSMFRNVLDFYNFSRIEEDGSYLITLVFIA
jgi:hypothetical protein